MTATIESASGSPSALMFDDKNTEIHAFVQVPPKLEKKPTQKSVNFKQELLKPKLTRHAKSTHPKEFKIVANEPTPSSKKSTTPKQFIRDTPKTLVVTY